MNKSQTFGTAAVRSFAVRGCAIICCNPRSTFSLPQVALRTNRIVEPHIQPWITIRKTRVQEEISVFERKHEAPPSQAPHRGRALGWKSAGPPAHPASRKTAFALEALPPCA